MAEDKLPERVARLEAEMENVKKTQEDLAGRLRNIELRIAFYSGLVYIAIAIAQHWLKSL